MAERKNFEIVTNKSKSVLHITGFRNKTNGEFTYSSTHCAGLTRIESFVINFRNSSFVAGADTLAELADKLDAKRAKGHKICDKCAARLAEDLAAEQPAETFELTYEVMNSKGKISRRNVAGPESKRDAAVAEVMARSDFIAFVN